MALPFLIPAAVAIASEVFPLIAGRFGGARGAELAETVVETAAAVVGEPGSIDAGAIIARLRADRTWMDELRYKLAELDAAEHARDLEDRESARRYQTAVGAGGRRRADAMLAAVALGLAICVGSVVALPSFASVEVSGPVVALVTTVAGALLKMLSDAFAFEFGSSKGSKDKDAQIATISAQFLKVATEMQSRAAAQPEPAPAPTEPKLAQAAPGPRRRRFVDALIAGAI